MSARRLAAVALTFTTMLVAAALGSCDNVALITACELPTLDEKGADGGPDPCHCDPPPSAGFGACACLSDPSSQQAIDDYRSCMVLYEAEQDAGGGGGH